MNTRANSSDVTLAQCIAMLEARRQCLSESLNEFARPISACDADFNSILAERAEIVSALTHLQPFCRGETRIPHPREDH
jgi:hypothetical protein